MTADLGVPLVNPGTFSLCWRSANGSYQSTAGSIDLYGPDVNGSYHCDGRCGIVLRGYGADHVPGQLSVGCGDEDVEDFTSAKIDGKTVDGYYVDVAPGSYPLCWRARGGAWVGA